MPRKKPAAAAEKRGGARDMKTAMIRSAKERAQLMAYLSNHPGAHSTSELCEQLGWTHKATNYRAGRMAAQGLIQQHRKGTMNFYGLKTTLERDDDPAAPAAKPARQSKAAVQDVELVMSGFLIVLGRNPASGRLRIVLQEA
jgi:hypothetical protein